MKKARKMLNSFLLCGLSIFNQLGFRTLLFFLLSNPLSAPDEPDVIGPEGIERFCKDIEEDPEDIVMLVLAWKMDAKQMGYFTLKEWLKGLSEIQ